jgi:hypothetical protein
MHIWTMKRCDMWVVYVCETRSKRMEQTGGARLSWMRSRSFCTCTLCCLHRTRWHACEWFRSVKCLPFYSRVHLACSWRRNNGCYTEEIICARGSHATTYTHKRLMVIQLNLYCDLPPIVIEMQCLLNSARCRFLFAKVFSTDKGAPGNNNYEAKICWWGDEIHLGAFSNGRQIFSFRM